MKTDILKTSPLLKLLIGNIREAFALGMIECDESDITSHIESTILNWNENELQENVYRDQMRITREKFKDKFRPLQAYQGETVIFCTIMSLGIFSQFWLRELRTLFEFYESNANENIEKLCKTIKLATKNDLNNLKKNFEQINIWLNEAGRPNYRGFPIAVGVPLNPMIRSFWVSSINTEKSDSTAQYWRDRLGLVHITAGDSPSYQELLVRFRFTATLANEELPPDRHLEHRKNKPNSLWVFRPSVLHLGNRRFVQGVAADRLKQPSLTGKTRDLSSTDYFEGENELLLLAGKVANAHLVGLDLLDDFAYKTRRDDDDNTFVDVIARERGWVLR